MWEFDNLFFTEYILKLLTFRWDYPPSPPGAGNAAGTYFFRSPLNACRALAPLHRLAAVNFMGMHFTFHQAVAPLLQGLGIEPHTSIIAESEMFSIGVDGIDIDVVGLQEGFVNLFCIFDCAPSPSSDFLRVIATANAYQKEHPPILTSTLEDKPSKVVLWSRMTIAEASSMGLQDLFARFVGTAKALHHWLNQRNSRSEPISSSPSSLSLKTCSTTSIIHSRLR